MIRKEKNKIAWLEFESFQEFPHVKHAIFLRQGGLSQEPFNSLNTSYEVGDVEERVRDNRKRICKILDVCYLKDCQQVHGVECIEATPNCEQQCKTGDALTTSYPSVALMIKHADCQAAILYDPIEKVIANIHCGWRGNVQNIYAQVISKMRSTYNTNPANLFVGISPSLGPTNAQFINYKQELPKTFWPFKMGQDLFNLWAISKQQLQSCGVLAHHIECAEEDTFTSSEDYFSYRRDKITGRHATVISLV